MHFSWNRICSLSWVGFISSTVLHFLFPCLSLIRDPVVLGIFQRERERDGQAGRQTDKLTGREEEKLKSSWETTNNIKEMTKPLPVFSLSSLYPLFQKVFVITVSTSTKSYCCWWSKVPCICIDEDRHQTMLFWEGVQVLHDIIYSNLRWNKSQW